MEADTQHIAIAAIKRRLELLRRIGKAIIEAQEEVQLLNNCCQQIVEFGGYCTAWVGMRKSLEPECISIVASFGCAEICLQEQEKLWKNDNPGNPWPWQIALQQKRHVVVNELKNSPYSSLLGDAMQRTGCSSLLSIPLIGEKQILGVLTVAGKEENSFNEEEIVFLRELADELVYGITAVHRKKEQERSYEEARNLLVLMRKQAVEILLKDQFLRGVFESIQDGISVLDKEYNILSVNPAMNKWYSHVLPLEGKKCFEVYHGINQPCKVCPTTKALLSGTPCRELIKHEGPDGELRGWFEVFALPYRNSLTGKISGVIEHVRNVTESIVLEKKLREEKERAQHYLDIVRVMILVLDKDANVVLINKKGLEILGCTEEEAIGKNWIDHFIPEKFRQDVRGVFRKIMSGDVQEVEYFENPVIRKDGQERLIAWYNTYIRNSSGDIILLLTSGEDVTEARKVSEELFKKSQELSRSNAELERFAFVISHDLKEPLRMIASYLQLLDRRYQDKLDKDAKEFIYYAVDGASRMQAMINGLMDYSQVSLGKVIFEHLNASDVLEQAIFNLKVSINESKALVTYDLLPMVWVDAVQLIRLFQNLIGNSVKFRSHETPRVHISVREEEREWVFLVKDNGVGFDPKHKSEIFDVFKRLHSRDYPGTGIGLSICKKIVERHGGKIWAESEIAKGATFYFSIPKLPAN